MGHVLRHVLHHVLRLVDLGCRPAFLLNLVRAAQVAHRLLFPPNLAQAHPLFRLLRQVEHPLSQPREVLL